MNGIATIGSLAGHRYLFMVRHVEHVLTFAMDFCAVSFSLAKPIAVISMLLMTWRSSPIYYYYSLTCYNTVMSSFLFEFQKQSSTCSFSLLQSKLFLLHGTINKQGHSTNNANGDVNHYYC